MFNRDDENIYKMQKMNEILNSDNRSQRSFVYSREKNELVKYCNQIFSSFKDFVQESEENGDQEDFDGITRKELNANPRFTFNLDALREIVDHLPVISSNVLEFDIGVMIELKMHEFIIEIISKYCDENYDTDFEILFNILHLICIWTNGKNEQSRLIFDQNFVKYLFNLAESYFVQNCEIVGYCLNSVKNLLISNYFPNEAIPIIMTELLLLLDQYIKESHIDDSIVNDVFFQSISNVFLCFQPIIRNYIKKKELKQLDEINGLIEMIKEWIVFVQNIIFGSDQNEDDIICKSACSAIVCMNDLVKEINTTSNDFFTKEFIEDNLINYLRSFNLGLKKVGLYTLECAFTTVGFQNFTAWEFVDDKFWKIISEVIKYEHDYELKLCFVIVVSNIIGKLPSVFSASANIEQNDEEDFDETENGQDQGMKENHKDGEEEEEEESRDIEDEYDADNENIEYQNEIISNPLNFHLMNLYYGGVLDGILSLAGKSEEKIGIRIKAILAITQNIRIFGITEIGHIVDTHVIPILIDTLEIVDEEHIHSIIDAILVFFEFIDRTDVNYKRKCIDMFEKASFEQVLNDILDNPLYVGKYDKIVTHCIDKFKELSKVVTDEQKKIYEESKERKKIYNDDDDDEVLRDYEEDDDENI